MCWSGAAGEPLVVVYDPGIAALMLDDAPEHFERRAGRQRVPDALLGRGLVRFHAGDHQHPRGEQHGELLEIPGAAALQRLERLDDFAGVADRAPERRSPSR